MIGSHLRLALRLPPRVVAARARALAAALAARPFLRAADRAHCTFAETPPGAPQALLDGPPDLESHREQVLARAQNHRAHRFDLLGSGWTHVGLAGESSPDTRSNPANRTRARAVWSLVDDGYAPIDWQVDFKSGYRWNERDWFGDIRVAPVPGADIKVPWELARMQHLPAFARAFALTRDEAWGREARNQILDFIAQNPPRFGVNWRCAMDAAIRAANWVLAVELLRAAGFSFDAAFLDAVKASLRDHGRHIMNNLERHPEGRGNHYLADIAGLAFIAAWLPRDAETGGWLDFAAREISAEILHQFNPDGSNFESSVCYHRLAAEMAAFALAVLAGRDADIPNLSLVSERLARAGEFLRDLTKPSARMAQIGDNDSGRFFKLDLAQDDDSLDPRATLAALAALTGRNDLLPGTGEGLAADLISRLARGKQFIAEGPRDAARDVRVESSVMPPRESAREIEIVVPGGGLLDGLALRAYPDFGVWLFRSSRLFLAVRCNAVGRANQWQGRGAHAHNDQLAIELAVDAEDWIADPGSYLYTPDADARNAYRSVAAHAAPQWPGREPGRLDLGLFWLLDQARARCLVFTETRFVGEHHGFGPTVTREVRVTDGAVIVRDTGLPGPSERRVLAGREAVGRFFAPIVPFSPGYGRQTRSEQGGPTHDQDRRLP